MNLVIGQSYEFKFRIMLTPPGVKPKEYVPYKCETFAAAFPEPVFGGKLDWKNEKFSNGNNRTVILSRETLINPRFVTLGSQNEPVLVFELKDFTPSGSEKDLAICTHYKQCAAIPLMDKSMFSYTAYFGYVMAIRDSAWNSLADALAYFDAQIKAGTPVMVSFRSQIPDDASIAVTTSGAPLGKSGENNLYSNTGNTTVSGRSDPIHVVSGLISQVADLNEIVTNIPKP